MVAINEILKENVLNERFISVGINPKDEKYREKYRDQLITMLQNSYKDINGYGGISDKDEELKSINNDISNSAIKMVERNGVITATLIYKLNHGRKSIAVATNGTKEGKSDLMKIIDDDKKMQRSWGEFSGAIEHILRKKDFPLIKPERIKNLTGKKIQLDPESPDHYHRDIGGYSHRKIGLGYPK
jgi:hypothetical protein